MNEKPILIQGAMSVETEILINALKCAEKIVIKGYEFYKGKINNKDIVISITKVGMVNSSVATILGINNFNPKCIVNQGVAGGHDKKVHKGDIVIGEYSSNMNSYKTMRLGEGEGIKPAEWKLITYNEGNDIEKEKIKCDSELLESVVNFLESGNLNVHVGTIISGDGWNNECDRINWFVNELDSLCEDMETYPVYKICTANSLPVLGIRMISNSTLNDESYERNLAAKLQEKIVDMIAKDVIC